MTALIKIAFFVYLLSCSEAQNPRNETTSSIKISRTSTNENGGLLLQELTERMAINVLGDEVVDLPEHLTVLEKHNTVFGQEILKAEGKTLDNYLAWVGCFQGMKYVGIGIFHPVEIGGVISRITQLDSDIPKILSDCAAKQPSIYSKSNEQSRSLNLTEEEESDELFFDIYLSVGTSKILEDAVAANSTSSDYSGIKCIKLPLCEAHYAASLTSDKRCKPSPKAPILASEKYNQYPFLRDENETAKSIEPVFYNESLKCSPSTDQNVDFGLK